MLPLLVVAPAGDHVVTLAVCATSYYSSLHDSLPSYC